MLKKLSFIMVVMMAISLFAGCAKTSDTKSEVTPTVEATPTAEATEQKSEEVTTNAEEKTAKKVGFLVPSTSNGFMAMLAEQFEKQFTEAGYEFSIGIADGDAKKQIEQIENMITLKMDTLVVVAVDPSSLTDVLTKAHNEGIKIINFTTDPGIGDVFLGADEKLVGSTVTEIASEWIDKQFPDAADGSVNVAIMEFRDTPEASHRSDGLQDIATINKKVNLKKTIQVVNTTKDAQTASENLFLTDPDLNCVLTYNSGMALGVNAYVMTPGSAIKDKTTFAVFGADRDAEVLANIKSSLTNESVLRGATAIGGDIFEVIANVVKYSNQLLAGEETIERDIAPVIKITTDNVDEFITK